MRLSLLLGCDSIESAEVHMQHHIDTRNATTVTQRDGGMAVARREKVAAPNESCSFLLAWLPLPFRRRPWPFCYHLPMQTECPTCIRRLSGDEQAYAQPHNLCTAAVEIE